MNNFRVRLLVGCDGLELDASRFRYRQLSSRSTGDPTCPLCLSGRENFMHFVAQCSALFSARDRLLADFPDLSELLHSDPSSFCDIIHGVEWVNDCTDDEDNNVYL